MNRTDMIRRFHELDDQLNNQKPPKLDPCESGMRFVSPDVATLMVERQRLAFAIVRSIPKRAAVAVVPLEVVKRTPLEEWNSIIERYNAMKRVG